MYAFQQRPLLSDPADYPSDWHPVLRRIYASRLSKPDEYRKTLGKLSAPQMLNGCEQAAKRLLQAKERGERVLVVGDYDVDGASATALCVKVLRQFSITVDYLIPNRFQHGYGLSAKVIQQYCHEHPRPDLILTVDNGISSHEAVSDAKNKGIDVIISDHHLPPSKLPEADIIINPQIGESPISKNLAGVGVAFYMMCALNQMIRQARPQSGLNMSDYLDLVALGTIADLVPMDYQNRILVSHGLAQIRRGQACAGIEALCVVADKEPGWLNAQDIAFALAPRLNAAGRLGDMSDGVQCLLAEDFQSALEFAYILDELNRKRRHLENSFLIKAQNTLQNTPEALPEIITLYQPDGHEGISGIIAARIKERYQRSTLIFVDGENPEQLKASGRAMSHVHLRQLLEAVHTQVPQLRMQFGGHAQACGLSLHRDDLSLFSQMVNDCCKRLFTQAEEQPTCYIDQPLQPELFNIAWADYLDKLEPWSKTLPAPCFLNEFEVVQYSILGERHSRYLLKELQSGQIHEALLFFQVRELNPRSRIRAAFELQVNRYRGRETLQLMLQGLQSI